MSCESAEDRGAPRERVDAKRSYDKVPLSVDWHDFLANLWQPGIAVALNYAVRPPRAQATGLQYKATTAGVTGKRTPRWPTTAGGTVTDGSVTWTAEAISVASLRATISLSTWPSVTGLTLSGESNADLIYQILADGGSSGNEYEVKHQVTLSNGEEKEAVILLPVAD